MNPALRVLESGLGVLGALFKSTRGVEQVVKEFEALLTQQVYLSWRGRGDLRSSMRSLVAEYCREAYIAGLAAGGLDEEDLTPEDEGIIADYVKQQLASVAGFVAAADDAEFAKALRPSVLARIPLWAQAVRAIGDAGSASADPKQIVEFRLRPGRSASEESCATCQRLLGKRMRWRDVAKQGLMVMPGNDNFECGGWRCPHGWFPVSS